jgi:transposase
MHRAKLVQRFVQEHSDAIELFFLPPYAPELNPDELAWTHIKPEWPKPQPKPNKSSRPALSVCALASEIARHRGWLLRYANLR